MCFISTPFPSITKEKKKNCSLFLVYLFNVLKDFQNFEPLPFQSKPSSVDWGSRPEKSVIVFVGVRNET